MGRLKKTVDLGHERGYQIEISPKCGMAVGKVHGIGAREMQQDAFGCSDTGEAAVAEKGLLLVLADGMGGMYDGEKASMTAVISCLEYFDQYDMETETAGEMTEMLYQANTRVQQTLGENAGTGGSTVIAALLKDSGVYWVSAGDSRICLCRNGELFQLNREHNYAAELDEQAARGEISREEAAAHPQRRALTSYIGIDGLPEIDLCGEMLELQKGDRLILMSDGVFGTLEEESIREALTYPAPKAAMRLGMKIEEKRKRGQDNYTAIIVEMIR